MWVVDPANTHEVISSAADGDVTAEVIARAVVDGMAVVRSSPRSQPALCPACNRPLRAKQMYIVVGTPARVPQDGDVEPPVLPLCGRCSPTPEAARLQATAVLRRLYPEISDVGTAGKRGGVH